WFDERCAQYWPRFGLMSAVANVDASVLRFDPHLNHCAQRRQDGIERIGKTDSFAARPRERGRGMRFPFRGHAVAEREGCLLFIIHPGKRPTPSDSSGSRRRNLRYGFTFARAAFASTTGSR